MTSVQRELSCDQYLPSYAHFFIQKFAPQNVLQNANFKALFGSPLRANGDCHATETQLQRRL